jgi:hypothetical protein
VLAFWLERKAAPDGSQRMQIHDAKCAISAKVVLHLSPSRQYCLEQSDFSDREPSQTFLFQHRIRIFHNRFDLIELSSSALHGLGSQIRRMPEQSTSEGNQSFSWSAELFVCCPINDLIGSP